MHPPPSDTSPLDFKLGPGANRSDEDAITYYSDVESRFMTALLGCGNQGQSDETVWWDSVQSFFPRLVAVIPGIAGGQVSLFTDGARQL
jgi:hypothetical protein